MLRVTIGLVAALLIAEAQSTASAQTAAPAPAATTAPAAKLSRIRLTVEHLKEMRARWVQNKPKLKACRAEVKAKGLHGDERWFFMEDCMGKS